MLREVLARFRSARLRRTESELDEEIRFHLEEDADERIVAGIAPEQARRAARLDFGNPVAVREATREAWGWSSIERAGQDVRYAVNAARRSPAFALASILTLALGIGATTAVFSVVDGVLLRPLPYPDPARLVRLSEAHAGAVAPVRGDLLSNLTFHAWRVSPSQTLSGIAAHRGAQHTVGFADGAERLECAAVTPSLFEVLGVPPAAGRFFGDGDTGEGVAPVVVVSDRLWRQWLGSDPAVIGRPLLVDGRLRVIVGITPPDFSFPGPEVLLWTPYTVPAPSGTGVDQHVSTLLAIGRLRQDASPAQAAAEGTAVARGSGPRPLAATMLFGEGGPVEVRVERLADQMTVHVHPALVVVSVAAALVLLMACANIASLLLSRGVARQRELAVRAALGASRARIVRQLFTEAAVLSGAGGGLGLLLGWALVAAMPVLAPWDFPRIGDIRLDGRVAACALVASVLAALLCGLLPALRTTGRDVAGALQAGGAAGGSGSSGAKQWRAVLLAAEAALAVLLLVGAMLMARSFVRLVSIDTGYDRDRVLTARVHVPASAVAPERTHHLVDSALERIGLVPAVLVAGAGNMMPFGGHTFLSAFTFPAADGGRVEARAIEYAVTPGYAEALGLRLRQGRRPCLHGVAAAARARRARRARSGARGPHRGCDAGGHEAHMPRHLARARGRSIPHEAAGRSAVRHHTPRRRVVHRSPGDSGRDGDCRRCTPRLACRVGRSRDRAEGRVAAASERWGVCCDQTRTALRRSTAMADQGPR
jgi:putative ABC transport system permease protein